MTELNKRMLTGSGLVAVILVAILSGPYGFGALVLLIALLCLREFYRLLEVPGERPYKTAGALLSACLVLSCLAVASGLLERQWLLLNVPAALAVFAIALYRRHSKRPFEELGITFLGVTAITLPLCFFALLPFLSRPAGSYQFGLRWVVYCSYGPTTRQPTWWAAHGADICSSNEYHPKRPGKAVLAGPLRRC